MFFYLFSIVISLFLAEVWSKRELNVYKINYINYPDFTCRTYTKTREYIYILLIASLPIFTMAVRYMVGTDYAGTYTIDFNLIKNGYRTRNEFLSYLMYKFAAFLSDDVQAYFIITSILCVFLTYIGIYKLSVKPIYSIVLYFVTYQYFTSMNGVRQMVATAIVIVALPFLFRSRYKIFVLFVIIAGLVHYAAFVYLIFMPLYFLKMDFKKSVFALCLMAILLPLLKTPIHTLIEYTPYGHYLMRNTEFGVSTLFILINVIVYIVMGFVSRNNKKYQFWMKIQMLIILIGLIQSIIPLAGRVMAFFSFFRMIIIPEISVNIKNSKMRFLFDLCIVGFYCMYCIYGMMYANWDDVLPYQTIFSR